MKVGSPLGPERSQGHLPACSSADTYDLLKDCLSQDDAVVGQ